MSLLARLLGGFFILTALLLFFTPAAAMQPLAEEEMDGIVASGFSSVLVEDHTAKLWLNIHVETHAYIESFKANHHSGGWDQEWYGVYLGEYVDDEGIMVPNPNEPLKLQGFILEAAFDNINSENMRLLSLKMGFNKVNGEISAADFASFTGHYDDDPRQAFYRQNRGAGTFAFDDDYIHVIFDARGDETDPASRPGGIYMDFGNARFTPDP